MASNRFFMGFSFAVRGWGKFGNARYSIKTRADGIGSGVCVHHRCISRKLENAARVATVALVLATVHEDKFRARRSDKLAP